MKKKVHYRLFFFIYNSFVLIKLEKFSWIEFSSFIIVGILLKRIFVVALHSMYVLTLNKIFSNMEDKIHKTVVLRRSWTKCFKKSALLRHKNEGLSISLLEVFFPTSPFISPIFMTSRGWFLRHFVPLPNFILGNPQKKELFSDLLTILQHSFFKNLPTFLLYNTHLFLFMNNQSLACYCYAAYKHNYPRFKMFSFLSNCVKILTIFLKRPTFFSLTTSQKSIQKFIDGVEVT